MPFVKVQKCSSWFSRYQVKFGRRRSGKTDYRARKRLTTQDKSKYSSPRHRLVVRFSNQFVLCQVTYATIAGDHVMASASSSELPRYGMSVGLKNYSAAYATGLLVARRLLQKLKMDGIYKGNTGPVDGKVVSCTDVNDAGVEKTFYVSAVAEERKPFHAILDVGIKATTTGARVFAAMKGAADGGLDIPHNERRFPGYVRETKEYNAETHADRIMGKHVGEYMALLEEEDPEYYSKRFSKYIAADVESENISEKFEAVHAAIRANPAFVKAKPWSGDRKKFAKAKKGTLAERKARVVEKKLARAKELLAKRSAAAEEEEEE